MYLLSLIPIMVAFVVIIKTKRAFESCVLGVVVGIVIYSFLNGDWNIPVLFYNFLADTSSSPGNMWVIIFTLAIGPVTQILFDSGATKAFTNWVTRKFANNDKKSLISIILLGIVVYADEFLKAAVLDSYGKSIGHKNRLPVETVGMMILSLCIPLVSWIPMATWSVYFVQLMESSGFTNNGTLDFVTKVMPFMFFPIILTLIIVLFALGIVPGFGSVKKAMRQVKDGTYDFSVYGVEDADAKEEGKVKPFDFVVPLAVLLAIGIWNNGDLAVACLLVIAFEMVWFLAKGLMSFGEFMDSLWKGMFSTFRPTVYLMFGFTFTAVLKLIGFPELVQVIASTLVPGAVLLFFFVSATAIGTLTGMFWPATSMFMAACLPIATEMGISPFLLSAVLFSAATFGTVLSPRGALVMFIGEELNSNPVDLMKSERPYALIAGGLTAVIYLIMGFVIL